MTKVKAAENVAEEAHRVAGHPSLRHQIGVQIGAGTAAGVGTYQINARLARHQGQTPPPLSASTGGMPNTGAETAVRVTNVAHHKYAKTVNKVHQRRYNGN